MVGIDVSVCILTYNHELYIERAVRSILCQQSDFTYEIVVLEDCSTDSTLDILKKLESEFPNKIRINANTKNKGHFLNLREGFKNFRGEFVCLLDGDDCWLTTHKMQKQVSFLKKNSNYIGVSHNVILRYDSGEEKMLFQEPLPKTVTIEDIISGKVYFHTSSLMHKNIFRKGLPATYQILGTGDWYLSMLYAEHGPIGYQDEAMSIYQIHKNGLWSNLSKIKQELVNIDAAELYNRLFAYRYDYLFRRISTNISSIFKNNLYELSLFNKIKYGSLYLSIVLTNPGSGVLKRSVGKISKCVFGSLNFFSKQRI